MARLNARSVDRLLRDANLVRHRGKIESAINNARRAVELAAEFGSLAAYFWRYQPPRKARPERITYPVLMRLSQTRESTALSRDLKRRGWTFVGPTTAYAFMQAVGLVNDHLEGCVIRPRVERAQRRFKRPGRRRH